MSSIEESEKRIARALARIAAVLEAPPPDPIDQADTGAAEVRLAGLAGQIAKLAGHLGRLAETNAGLEVEIARLRSEGGGGPAVAAAREEVAALRRARAEERAELDAILADLQQIAVEDAHA